ncbi:hypothetical protein A2165_02195 [Candidatus Curtissbacteria bacterium RBG_13_40_7]|uniref:Rod shape-determining protein RodA n=1 Tax=Candidatus Curtissbacteria bacterium RBG_13_40_7 TaxID=1797706 RepID=A0A1F5FYE4_9BACT|nr:MAG: hypothetical protein A2165_02195 [Candidatus Curtissbacteria bacterium RBG_13_40_7]
MRSGWDWTLTLAILGIGALSLLAIFSINKNLALSQAVFWLGGLLLFTFFSFIDFRNWPKLSVYLYILVLIFLISLPVISEPVRGSVRWFDLGFIRFQPSEIAKVASILVLAAFYKTRSAASIKNLIFSFLIILPAIMLIIFEPDIGNSLTLVAVWIGISAAAGLKIRHIFALVVVSSAVAFLVFNNLAPYQKERINTFLNPNADPLGTGFAIIQSKIAIGSGQFFGRGLGQGSQSQLNFLPEAESDFIFASITEQLGLLGALILIALFVLLVVKILSFVRSADRFGQLIIAGCVSYLILQFFINIGMNMAVLPVTGITLPLVSYGGSSLISTLFLFGIILSIKRLSTGAKNW